VARTPQDVTDAELAILQLLWERGPLTRRQISDVLYPESGAAAYTTVQKLLERLASKQ
jgi:predicted transcriptional regulator